MQPKRLSVLGVGLLGGSIGLAVRSMLSSCRVVGYGHRTATLRAALEAGALDDAYDDPRQAVRGADLVILCTPVGLLPELLDQIAPALEPGAIVTDVGSTKRSIVARAGQVLNSPAGGPSRARFVGSHPMAGSEKRGVQHAHPDLFRDALCITTPDPHTDPDALEQVEAFWRFLGMRTRRLSPDAHDRLIADISHLPHAVAAALVGMQSDESLSLCGRGFLDATRIAGGDGGLWRDIFLDNRDNLRDSIRRLQENLEDLLNRLDGGDGDGLTQWLDQAAERRRKLGDERGHQAKNNL
jgi:prephenate dehydrogenase